MARIAAKKAFIIGHPVSHSLSPKLHGYWLKQYGIDGDYEAINVPPEYLVKTLKKLPEKGFIGGNVTIPHKEKVMMLCDEVKGIGKKIKAVNTLVFKDNKIIGYNTDADGFVENLRSNGVNLENIKSAMVIGSGGAAKAIIAALRMYPVKVFITNRTNQKARELATEFKCESVDWDKKEEKFSEIELLINTTSLGMKGQPELEIDLSRLPVNAVVNDIVYNPLETALLKQAREKNLKTVDGLGMLLYQAVEGFELWFGKKPEVTKELREFVLKAMEPKLHD